MSYTTHIQYTDGKTEYVELPVEYEVGTKLIVTKKKDGSVVVALAE